MFLAANELNCILLSLVAPKNPILLRQKDDGAKFTNDELITFNEAYEPKSFKVKVISVQIKETVCPSSFVCCFFIQ